MTYEEIVAKAKETFGDADASSYEDHLAIQINVTGEGEGIFYTEIKDGVLSIEPYDYKGHDVCLTASGDDIISLLGGTLDVGKALEEGRLRVEGNIEKALSIMPVIENHKKKAAKKTTTKKAASKTTKAAEKTTEKAEKAEKAAKSTTKAAGKAAPKAAKPAPKAAKKEEAPAIVGLTEPKKAPAKAAAPKSTAKKTAEKPAKSSTKSAVTKSAKSSKNKKG